MRIRCVSLLNLNSLRGEHRIDLGGEPFASAGIFAITGPTGAGKTTLLDAITLALYGRAARYGSDPNPADMMSRHTGECRAEVTFEVAGKSYRAAWHLKRARCKPDGKIQPPKRFVYGSGGEVLTQKIKEADTKIEALCGLDYARFMRSVLLAQGEFARFLKSKPDERAALLESLTGTAIYSQLGAAAHIEHSRRERELTEKRTAAGLISLLDDDALAALNEEVVNITNELTKFRKTQKQRDTALAAARDLALSIKEESALLQSQHAHATRRSEAAPLLAKLDLHHRAAPFFPALQSSTTAAARAKSYRERAHQARVASESADRIHLESLAAALAVGTRQIVGTETAIEKTAAALAAASAARDVATTWLASHQADCALAKILPDLREALALLTSTQKTAAAAVAETTALEAQLAAAVKHSEKATAAVTAARAKSKTSATALKRAADALGKAEAGCSLAARRAELEALTQLRSKTTDRHAHAAHLAESIQRIEIDQKKLGASKSAVAAAKKEYSLTEKHVELLTRHLADARLHASFEEHRASLSEGDPCPLCGALEHPYCEAAATPPSDLERELASARTSFEKSKTAVATADSDHTTLTARISEAEKTISIEKARVAKIDDEMNTLTARISGAEGADLALLQEQKQADLSALETAEKTLATAKEAALNTKSETLQRATEAKVAAAKLTDIQERILDQKERANRAQKSATEQLVSLGEQLAPLSLTPDTPKLTSILRERAATFGKHEKELAAALVSLEKLEAEKKRHIRDLENLHTRVAKLTKLIGQRVLPETKLHFATLDEAAEIVVERNKESATCTAMADELQKECAAATNESAQADADLAAALANSAFADPAALRAATLDPAIAEEAENKKRALEEESQQLTGALAECQKKLAARRAENPPEGTVLEKLQATHADAEKSIEDLTARRADLNATLRSDTQARAKQYEMIASLADETARLKTWTHLSSLIGSHDGKKFRVFAQGLSLDVLLHHANDHLARLNPRYLLSRAHGETLELDIIDLYQASTRRPMSSLSGGESFLASLALALGLSHLAGRNVQIDSLFIDEGFGTLDSETLDTALSALESLRLQEKTVGVISHVDILKERIGVQINVARRPDGSSSLEVRGARP